MTLLTIFVTLSARYKLPILREICICISNLNIYGVIHLVRTHEGGEGDQANAYECVQGGRGGGHMKYVRKTKNY